MSPTATPVEPSAPATPHRPVAHSVLPRVTGIIAIVFACIGLMFTFASAFGFQAEAGKYDELGAFGDWQMWYLAPGLLVFALHLIGGILCTLYKRKGPNWLTAYGILALLLIIVDVIITVKSIPGGTRGPMFEDLAAPRLGLALFGFVWPIVVLVLINDGKSRGSCNR